MFCENCGRLLNENDKFCQSCGKRVNLEETLSGDVSKIETEVLDTNANVQYSVATQENTESIDIAPMPKPHKKWRKVGVIAAVLILLSSIIAYAAPVIKNMAQKLYYSPENYSACNRHCKTIHCKRQGHEPDFNMCHTGKFLITIQKYSFFAVPPPLSMSKWCYTGTKEPKKQKAVAGTKKREYLRSRNNTGAIWI